MKLFDPLQIGPYTLQNRVVLAPLVRARCDLNRAPTPLVAQYYAQRASAGLLITEGTHVSPNSTTRPTAAGHYNALQNSAWKVVVDAVHAAGGILFQQLYHVGRKALQQTLPHGRPPIAPSALAASGGILSADKLIPFPLPRAVHRDEIAGVVHEFRVAARYAAAAGFDGIELAASTGFLLDQFLRDGSNRREDDYGGAIENRIRFMLEVVDAVSESFAPNQIGMRLSPHFRADGIDDSDTLATFTHVARELGRRGLAYLHLQEGLGRDSTPYMPLHLRQLDTRVLIGPSGDEPFLAETLRAAFGGPLILNGNFSGDSANQVLVEGRADAVAFGRLFISNPDLPQRLRTGAALTPPDAATYYTGGAKGYIDYPTLAHAH